MTLLSTHEQIPCQQNEPSNHGFAGVLRRHCPNNAQGSVDLHLNGAAPQFFGEIVFFGRSVNLAGAIMIVNALIDVIRCKIFTAEICFQLLDYRWHETCNPFIRVNDDSRFFYASPMKDLPGQRRPFHQVFHLMGRTPFCL